MDHVKAKLKETATVLADVARTMADVHRHRPHSYTVFRHICHAVANLVLACDAAERAQSDPDDEPRKQPGPAGPERATPATDVEQMRPAVERLAQVVGSQDPEAN